MESTKKPFSISYEYETEYLRAHVSGEEDMLQNSIMFWLEIKEECLKHNYKKCLVTENFKTVISTTEMFIMVDKLIQEGSPDVKIAFVDSNIDHLYQNKFAEDVAVNRGVNVKVFTDTEEAKKWLLSE